LSLRLAREEELIAARNKAEELDRENVEIATKLAKKEQELDLRTQEKVSQLHNTEIYLGNDRDQWQPLVKVVIKHGVPSLPKWLLLASQDRFCLLELLIRTRTFITNFCFYSFL
jgi:hypothetical protein